MKRSHKNTRRLTARERIHAYQDSDDGASICMMGGDDVHSLACDVLLKAFEAHARQALARKARR